MLSNSVIAAAMASGYLTTRFLQLNPAVSIEPATLVPLATVLAVAYGANLTVLFYALIVMRQILAVEVLSPITGEMRRLMDDTAHIDSILRNGGERARARAEKTMREVREIIGFLQ